MLALKIDQLSKRYGAVRALNQLSLEINHGEIFGILGPNGSGKTTTLAILLDVIKADSGHFTWFENKYGKNTRRHIGAILETPNFYPYLNAKENLDIIAHIKNAPDYPLDYLLELVDLNHRRKSYFSSYSLGMKQRLAIAASLIGDPDVLIFDEPTNGLDPQGISEVRNTILKIAKQGKTILFASHILAEVEKICTHVAIIKKGNLLASGPVGSIINQDFSVEIQSANLPSLKEIFEHHPSVNKISQDGELLILQVEEDTPIEKINQYAFSKNITLTHLKARRKSLEAEFLEIIS